ncbi:MAG TPA: septal ring lytic transglycosylase RlpA family protein [Rhodocyclaceae bacterium]
MRKWRAARWLTVFPIPHLSFLIPLLLTACGSQISRPVPDQREAAPVAAKKPEAKTPGVVLKRGGGFYQDDGPGDNPPPNMEAIPDAVPKNEPLHKFANNPYSVLGRDYVPQRRPGNYRESGVASWYGKKFHGQKTSSGETYDMYGMTAAHPTLPIPSYARVSNPANGKTVVVRVNDRGPFHTGRVIDLSYTAAWKLGLVGNGSGQVTVESVVPGQETQLAALPAPAPALPAQAKPAAAEVAAAPALPQVSDGQGVWLQLGAFGNRDNAEALKARIGRELGGLAEMLVIQSTDKLHRLRLGPYADAAEARRMAERVAEQLELKPVVVSR